MGGSISVELECDPLNPGTKQLKGTLILVNKGKKEKRLIRPPYPRVTLQYRAKCVLVKNEVTEEEVDVGTAILWSIGGYVVDEKNGPVVLQPGPNRFPFCFDIPDSPVLTPNEFYQLTKCKCTYWTYDHILRAGCPPLTRDLQSFPRMLPRDSDYHPQYLGNHGIDGLGLAENGVAVAGIVLSFALSFAGG
ncbi:MAG: hypothetical protein SGARI_006708 [Bacillariaceae sp.]